MPPTSTETITEPLRTLSLVGEAEKGVKAVTVDGYKYERFLPSFDACESVLLCLGPMLRARS